MRSEAIKAERRRRNTDRLGGQGQKLTVDETKLDRKNFVYRWAVDEKSRIYDLTQKDDWEVVSDREGMAKTDGAGMGADISILTTAGSGGVRQVLLRKPKDWHEDDMRAQARAIDEQEAGLRQGPSPDSGADGNVYVRAETSIRHEGR